MKARRAYTLAELVVTVLLIVVVTGVAVPRLQFGLKHRKEAEVTAWKIVTDLRRTRSLAILHAATNPKGFALNIEQNAGSATYEIVDLGSKSTVDSHTIAASVGLSGRTKFEFGPLGALKEENSPSLDVSADDKTFTISVIPATGMVKCLEK